MVLSARLQRQIVLMLAAASLACAPAPRMGEAVDIAEESAIIIWDATAKTQHFIRRASFETKATDFGFLVPTPTVPTLAEADDASFHFLERLTAPQEREIPRDAKAAAGSAPAAPQAVTVIATAKVAGYDAAVLEATDAGALDRWLKAHGYHSSPELVDWYKPYIAQNWKITAFKIAKGEAGAGKVDSTAVRMSFETDKPFFPYREPAIKSAAASAPRMLRIYLLAEARFDGRIGADGAWPGRAVWSKQINDAERGQLLESLKLPASTARAAARLTEFADDSSPRPGINDLFFEPAADQSIVEKIRWVRKTPTSEYFVIGIIALVALALLAGAGFVVYRIVRAVVRSLRR